MKNALFRTTAKWAVYLVVTLVPIFGCSIPASAQLRYYTRSAEAKIIAAEIAAVPTPNGPPLILIASQGFQGRTGAELKIPLDHFVKINFANPVEAETRFKFALEQEKNIVIQAGVVSEDLILRLHGELARLAKRKGFVGRLLFLRANLPGRAKLMDQARYFSAESFFAKLKSDFDSVVVVDTSIGPSQVVYTETRTATGRLQTGTSAAVPQLRQTTVEKFFLQLLSLAQVRPVNRGYDLFLDLDWTLFYNVTNGEQGPAADLIRYEGAEEAGVYRAAEGLVEFLQRIKEEMPDVRLHALTGATYARAKFLLGAIQFSDGTTAADRMDIFGKESLTPISDDARLRFPERFAKYVQRLIPDLDMTRSSLVDDQPEFSRYGLTVLDSMGKLNYHEAFDHARAGRMFEARTQNEFDAEKQRLDLLFNVIRTARALDLEGKGEFAKIIQHLTFNPRTQERYSLTSPELAQFLELSKQRCRDLF